MKEALLKDLSERGISTFEDWESYLIDTLIGLDVEVSDGIHLYENLNEKGDSHILPSDENLEFVNSANEFSNSHINKRNQIEQLNQAIELTAKYEGKFKSAFDFRVPQVYQDDLKNRLIKLTLAKEMLEKEDPPRIEKRGTKSVPRNVAQLIYSGLLLDRKINKTNDLFKDFYIKRQ